MQEKKTLLNEKKIDDFSMKLDIKTDSQLGREPRKRTIVGAIINTKQKNEEQNDVQKVIQQNRGERQSKRKRQKIFAIPQKKKLESKVSFFVQEQNFTNKDTEEKQQLIDQNKFIFQTPKKKLQKEQISSKKTERKHNFRLKDKANSLWNFRQLKKETDMKFNLREIQNLNVIKILNRADYYEKRIPFIPEYFSPIHKGMQNFLDQCARLQNRSSCTFYQDNSIGIRLIKDSKGSQYIVSLLNRSFETLQICYSKKLQRKCSDEFSRLINFTECEKNVNGEYEKILKPSEYADIKVIFSTVNPNFKFLQLCLRVNEKCEVFHLPITLLDQAIIGRVNFDFMSSSAKQNGMVIKSYPISVSKLPSFFDTSTVLKKSNNLPKIIGSCSLTFSQNQYQKCTIYPIIKIFDEKKSQVQILYSQNELESEDYAKVILELLYLLL